MSMENYNIPFETARTMDCYKFTNANPCKTKEEMIAFVNKDYVKNSVPAVLEFGNVDIELSFNDEESIDEGGFFVCVKYAGEGWRSDDYTEDEVSNDLGDLEKNMFECLMKYAKTNNLYWSKENDWYGNEKLKKDKSPDFKPLYRKALHEAVRMNEKDEWRESFAENERCRDYIDRLISENFNGLRLGGNIAEQTIAEFGHDRTQWLLANTIQHYDYDVRFSPQNKAWAQSIYIQRPTDLEKQRDPYLQDHNSYLLLRSSQGLVDMVARKALQLYADLNLYNINNCEPGDVHTKNFAGKLLIVRDTALNEASRTPENQLFFATHGNGCTPGAIGRSVFGHFLSDGETAAFDRSDILGIIDEDQIPEWAALKLHEIQNPSDAPDEAQGQSMEGG